MSSSDSSSEMSLPDDAEDLVLDFEFGLEGDIQDVVRLGTLGQFQKARSLADESLKQLDYVFPIAIEIMRLMYDQEDYRALYAYTIALMSDRTKQKSWKPRELCILHLMHDVCGMLSGNPGDVATTPFDLLAANLSNRTVDSLDDEQIIMTVLILKIVYTKHKRAPDINHRVLPLALQQEKGLYTFIGSLIRQENYWAAAQVMTICLQLPMVDCAALWKPTETFLRGGSADDDEPTAYFRLLLIQTFMEGLLRMMRMGFDPSGALAKWWAAFHSASASLLPVLQQKFGRGIWLNSRGHWRGLFLEINKRIFDRNPEIRQHALKQSQQLLKPLHQHAVLHDDRSLLITHQVQINILTKSTPQSLITYLDGATKLPTGSATSQNDLPLARHERTQHRSAPATQVIRQSNVTIAGTGSSKKPQTPLVTLQSRPPWQHSQSLGGYFVYRPSTDTIMLQDGRQFMRPTQMHRASLTIAAWEGPLTGSGETDPGGSRRPIGPQLGQAPKGRGLGSAHDQAEKPGSGSREDSRNARIEGRANIHRRGGSMTDNSARRLEAEEDNNNSDDDSDEDEDDDDDENENNNADDDSDEHYDEDEDDDEGGDDDKDLR